MKNTPPVLVSVITTCFNSEKTILDTVLSVQSQTYQYIEHIIIDDGSTLALHDYSLEYSLKKIKTLYQKNMGVSSARNNAIAQSNGELLVILDSDDTIDVTFIEKAVAIFNNKKDTSLVGCYVKEFERSQKKIKIAPFNLQDFYYKNTLFPSIIMLKRKEYFYVGGYDKNLIICEDWDLYLRIVQNHGSVEIIKEYLFNYRKNNTLGSLTDRMSKERKLVQQSHQYISEKNEIYFKERGTSIIGLATYLLRIKKRAYKNQRNISIFMAILLLNTIIHHKNPTSYNFYYELNTFLLFVFYLYVMFFLRKIRSVKI